MARLVKTAGFEGGIIVHNYEMSPAAFVNDLDSS